MDVAVLGVIGVPWLAVPWYLETVQAPFSEVATASLILMAAVLTSSAAWFLVVRRRIRGHAGDTGDSHGVEVAFFGFLAYFWSLVDDAPVGFDSVYTWPEVTSGFQHVLTEVVLHSLTALFMLLAVRSAFGGRRIASARGALGVFVLTAAALWASYFQNTPLHVVQSAMLNSWYPLDFAEHVVSVMLLYFAIRLCRTATGTLVEMPGPGKNPAPFVRALSGWKQGALRQEDESEIHPYKVGLRALYIACTSPKRRT